MLARAGRIFDRLITFLAAISGIILLLMALTIAYEVVLRYFFANPTLWTVQANEYALLWITFLGTAWVLKRNKHVKVDIVVNRLNPKAQNTVYVITAVLGALICLFLLYFATSSTWSHFVNNVIDRRGYDVPKFIFLSVIPFGSLLLMIQFIRDIYGRLRKIPEKVEEEAIPPTRYL